MDIQREYDLVQLIGEGWFSRVYLAERRSTREEVIIMIRMIMIMIMMMDEECFSKVYLAERRSTREEVMIMIIIHDDYDCMWTRFMMMLRDINGRVFFDKDGHDYY